MYIVDSRSRRVREIAGPVGIVSVPRDNRWIYFSQSTVESDIWLAKLE
jgi:hypothetical protein